MAQMYGGMVFAIISFCSMCINMPELEIGGH